MSFHFPNNARYIQNIADNVAEFEIESPSCFADDGTPEVLKVLVGTLFTWEFVCAEAPDRCPTWSEMKAAKDACWDAEDVCLQLHPAQSRYVNKSEFSLWIWRPTDVEVPQPPLWREHLGTNSYQSAMPIAAHAASSGVSAVASPCKVSSSGLSRFNR